MHQYKSSNSQLNILVLYCAYTTRSNLLDSLYSFRRYTKHRVYFFNLAARRLPNFLTNANWDLVVFHTLFFTRKFDRVQQQAIFDKVTALAENKALKVLSPQDEFVNSDIVCDFARNIGASIICTVQPAVVWPKIYGELSNVELRSVLTGYLDPARITKCMKYLSPSHQRTLTVGYRTIGKPVPWFGRHGFLKELISQRFSAKLVSEKISHSISTEDKDTLAGEKWYDFLGNCKYVLGVEGGTSIFDRDGHIKKKTDVFLRKYPTARFEEIEAECFKGIDGDFKGYAISPRHLEACMTGTCQILTEGAYNGILIPYVHYIPVAKDFHNIDEVVQVINNDQLRASIVSNAYRDIVASGKYSMDRYPQIVIGDIDAYIDHALPWLQRLKMYIIYTSLYALDIADRVVAKMWARYKAISI